MSDAESPSPADALPTFERIVVAVNGSPHSRAALDAAVRLAGTLDTELVGLFVEDERLVQTAQLSFTAEVRAYTAPARALTEPRLQRQLRYRANDSEHALARRAAHADVPHDFQAVEGDVTDELMQAAASADLLVMGKTSTDSGRRRLGSTSRTLLAEAPCPVLVLRKRLPRQEPLLLYYDGSAPAETALTLSARLVHQALPPPLKVLLPPSADPSALRDDLRRPFSEATPPMRVTPLSPDADHRLSTVARQSTGLLILPKHCSPLQTTSLQQFLYEIDRPLLMIPD